MSQEQNNQSQVEVDEGAGAGAGAGAGTGTGASQDTTPAAAAPAPAAAASGSTCTPRADPSDRFDALGRAWCDYHKRFTPTHSTKYCSALQTHQRRNANPGPSRHRDHNVTPKAVRAIERFGYGRVSSSGGVRKPQVTGKTSNKELTQMSDEIAKLRAELNQLKNQPVRSSTKKDFKDDEDGAGSPGGAQDQITS